jgi:hypothetical protein
MAILRDLAPCNDIALLIRKRVVFGVAVTFDATKFDFWSRIIFPNVYHLLETYESQKVSDFPEIITPSPYFSNRERPFSLSDS